MSSLFKPFLLLLFCPFIVQGQSIAPQLLDTLDDNIAIVEQGYEQKEHERDYQQITEAAKQLLKLESAIDADDHPHIIGKAHLLLTYSAYINGDSAQAYNHASLALKHSNENDLLKLNAYLAMMGGLYAKGQYHTLVDTAQQALTLADKLSLYEQQMLAIIQKAIGHAMLKEYNAASELLERSEPLLTQSIERQHSPVLLEALSQLYVRMQLYDDALQAQQLLIALIEGTERQTHIERAYFTLGKIYYRLGRYHDAYNAYWGSRSFSLQQAKPLKVAYAELGLGQTLIKLEQYQQAYELLSKSEKLFKSQNITLAYLQSIIALAEVNYHRNNPLTALQLLSQAEAISENKSFIDEQLAFYPLLVKVHKSLEQFQEALAALEQFNRIKKQQEQIELPIIKASQILKNERQVSESKNLYDQMLIERKNSERQQTLSRFILVLLATALCLFLLLLHYIFRLRSHVGKHSQFMYYDGDVRIASSEHTKELYHQIFKQARKFNYPLTVAVVTIDNYDGLASILSTQELKDVKGAITQLITKIPSDTMKYGELSESEFLLIFEHQQVYDVSPCFDHLKNGLAQLLFAKVDNNLITITIGADNLMVSDVDPYQFLARLSLLK